MTSPDASSARFLVTLTPLMRAALPTSLPTASESRVQLATRAAIDPLDVPPPAATAAAAPTVGRVVGRLAAMMCFDLADAVRGLRAH